MSQIVVDFQFEVGDIIAHAGWRIGEDYPYSHSRPAKFQIVERSAVECHGGVQTFYSARPFNPDGNCSEKLIGLVSIEAVHYPSEEELASLHLVRLAQRANIEAAIKAAKTA